ncbi:MAG: NB-ARC domain-containing protein [Elainellaceae cyanobacterium]
MNAEEALAIIEETLRENRLSKLQRTVFCQAWNERSYLEMAHCLGYELGYIKQTGSQLWQLLSQAFDEKVTKHNLQQVVKRKVVRAVSQQTAKNSSRDRQPAAVGSGTAGTEFQRTTSVSGYASLPLPLMPPETISPLSPLSFPLPVSFTPKVDWGDAVDASAFYGRNTELALLKQWILDDRCRFVGLFGMGGIGKTTLSIALAKQIQEQFEYVIWRSLRNAPPLLDLLADLIQFLSSRQNTALPESLEGRIAVLLGYLRQHRCLIVLDNGETVMSQGDCNGGYLIGYEGYAQLWQAIGESSHQSSLILTSREKPKGIAAKEGKALPMRSLRLTGLSADIGQTLFNIKGDFTGTDADWRLLVEHYAGNPLALKMVAPVIQDLFDGQVADFMECLQEGTLVFSDIQDLLAQQVNRLSELEQQVMYWLAIARQPITLYELRSHFTPPVVLGQLLEALTSLERRCLINKTTSTLVGKTQTRFTLQPVVMEYLTDRLIEQVSHELQQPEELLSCEHPAPLLQTHALIQPQVKDYIRETQARLILQPVADRLLAGSSVLHLANQLRQIVVRHLRQRSLQGGYAGGNVINLLCQVGADLSDWDFSHLAIWNAYLRGVTLHRVNFTGADLAKSVFTETFSQVLTVAFSPDGKLLATGDVNHEIHVWQVADGKPLLSCTVDEGWVWSVAFSPNGRLLASSANRTVSLWDVQTGTCLQTFRGYTDRVFSVAFSPDGWLLATGSEDHLIRIWDIRTGQCQILAGHQDEVRSVSFAELSSPLTEARSTPQSPGWLLASGSFDGTVRLWDTATGNCLRVLAGHQHWVWSVAFSPDGQFLASGGSDRTLNLWDVSTGQCLKQLSGHEQQIRTVAFSRDGRTLASGSDDRTVRVWDYRTGECQRILSGHRSWISSVAFSPDNHLLASGSEDQSVRLWDGQTRLCVKMLQGYSNGVWSVAFDAQDQLLASGSQDRIVRLWDRQTGELRGSLQGHTSWIWSVVFSPRQPLLASGSEDRTIKLWDAQTQQLLQTLEGHQNAVLAVLFSPDGHTLFSGSLDGTIKLWSAQTGACRQTLSGHTGGVWCLALSSDGRLLASGSQDQTIKLWDVSQECCLKALVGHEGWIRSVAISPDRQTVISGSADGIVKLWRLDRETCYTLEAHRGPVLSVVFAPTGETFASCGTDGKIKLWDATTGECKQTVQGHDRWVRFLCYSADGQTLASCSQDETVKLWQVSQTLDFTPRTLRIPRPYEGMTIAQAMNLTPAQKTTLKMLGAVDS